MSALTDPRKVFEEAFYELAKRDERIVAVSCDSASGGGLGKFKREFPGRFIEVGIAEQSAIGICAGLAQQGFIPFVVAITPFITMRCYEQLRDDVAYTNMNIKVVGSGGGLAYSTLGSTHEAIEDIALIRTLPHFSILNPADGEEVRGALAFAAGHAGPVYIRMPRQKRPDLCDPQIQRPEIGQAQILREGKDAALLSFGILTQEALDAARLLEEQGVDAAVVHFSSVRPLDGACIRRLAGSVEMLFTLEEHALTGGFGSAVADCLAAMDRHAPLCKIGVPDGAKETGPFRELLEWYGLTGEKIAQTVLEQFRTRESKI